MSASAASTAFCDSAGTTDLPFRHVLLVSVALLQAPDELVPLPGDHIDIVVFAEEYEPAARRHLGNFPQAFTHVGLINTAINLSKTEGPAEHRAQA